MNNISAILSLVSTESVRIYMSDVYNKIYAEGAKGLDDAVRRRVAKLCDEVGVLKKQFTDGTKFPFKDHTAQVSYSMATCPGSSGARFLRGAMSRDGVWTVYGGVHSAGGGRRGNRSGLAVVVEHLMF